MRRLTPESIWASQAELLPIAAVITELRRQDPTIQQRHCSPPHWRRGHWHTVLHGEKRQNRRMQWFQPVYVGLS